MTDLARARKVPRGRKVRTDTTVVETDIHSPSDSTLLADGVRVLSRLVCCAQGVLTQAGPDLAGCFRARIRSAAKLARRIGETMVQGRQKAVTRRSGVEGLPFAMMIWPFTCGR